MHPINILLVGSGNLGSRHLQALLSSDIAMNILIIEPLQASRELTISRMSDIQYDNFDKKISFYNTSSELPSLQYKICILSTSANERLSILCDLIARHEFEYMILEKVAFQSGKDFEIAIKALQDKTVAYVNCPRRLDPLYNFIKSYIIDLDKIKINVTGINWGLASNAVHFLDLWHFFTNIESYSSDLSGLNKKLYVSKRKDYIDLFGNITFISGESSLYLESIQPTKDEDSINIMIEDGSRKIKVDQFNQNVYIYENSEEIVTKSFSSFPVSISSTLAIEDIIKNDHCKLTSLEETHSINLDFLESLLYFCNSLNDNHFTRCPIT